MGFFQKLFSSTPTTIKLTSPLNGSLLPKSEIPDPTFADEVLGPTVCFKPGSDGVVYAPCDGVITQIFKTAHAVTISSNQKVELLIHVGINTVDLKGQGFEALVHDDEKVTAGQPLIKFDQEVIARANLSNLVPLVICNVSDFAEVKFIEPQDSISTKDVFCEITPHQK